MFAQAAARARLLKRKKMSGLSDDAKVVRRDTRRQSPEIECLILVPGKRRCSGFSDHRTEKWSLH
jgi:hypothetical protein